MTEKMFLKISDNDEKEDITDAIVEEISLNKKIDVYNCKGEVITYFSKYEVLRDGISFDIEEPVPDYEIKKHNLMDHVDFEKNKEGGSSKLKIIRFVA